MCALVCVCVYLCVCSGKNINGSATPSNAGFKERGGGEGGGGHSDVFEMNFDDEGLFVCVGGAGGGSVCV
jgi:hypothetical protein